MMFADPATEDDGDLVGLADCSISIKQPLPEAVQRCPATKDEIVAELDLREEQPMLTACLRSEEHTSELQSPDHLVCRLLLEKKKKNAQDRANARAVCWSLLEDRISYFHTYI